jgi:hypothetical protein
MTASALGYAAVVAAAPAATGPCDSLPGPARLACEASTGVTTSLGGAVGGAVSGAAESAIGAFASAFAQAAGHFLGKLGEALQATTEVDVTAPWFLERYALMFAVSALLTFALLILSVVKAVARGHAAEAIKAGTMHYLFAVTASAFAPAFVYLLLELSDRLSALLAFGAQDEVDSLLADMGTAVAGLATVNAGSGVAAALLASLATVFCAGILWIELLLRTAIIYVSLLFAAPTFSGLVDRALWRHSRRWVGFVIAVVFAKPVVVAVLSLAAAGADNGGSHDAFTSVFVSLALLIVAIFCVGLLFRVVPSLGDEIAGAISARREINSATPHSPVPGPGPVMRQSLQSHMVRSVATRKAVVAGAAAPPAVAAAVGAVAAHRAATTAGRVAGAATPAKGAVR